MEMREASKLYRALVPIPFPELFTRIDDALGANGSWTCTKSSGARVRTSSIVRETSRL